jgi:tetratricopeptide (TPR) repeat protein
VSDQGPMTDTGQDGWSGHSARSGQAEGWKERCDGLAREINGLLRSGVGGEARAKEAELFQLLRVHSSARLAADTVHTIARHHYAAGDTASALSAFRDARTGYLEVSDADGLAEADRGTALIHAGALEWGRAVAALHESARDLMQLGATEEAARAHLSAAAFRTVGGRISDAEPELDTADRLLNTLAATDPEHDTRFVAAITRARLAVLRHRTRDAEAALVRAQTAAAQDRLLTAFIDDQRAQLALQRGDVSVYLDLLEQAAAKFQEQGAGASMASVEVARIGLALEQQGDRDRAMRTLRRAANLYVNSPPAGADESVAARVTPYLVVANLELDEDTLQRLARLSS